MKRQTNTEAREEVLHQDKKRDFSVYLAVSIGALSLFAAVCGAGAVAVLKALENFRVDIAGYWTAGMPMIFPVVTGIAAGYHRKRTAVGVHVGILIFTLLGGLSSYGYSVDVVYQRNSTCIPVELDGDCYRPMMSILYLAFGAAALLATIFGLLCSFCACKQATKRIACRHREAEIAEHQHRAALQEAKKLEARKLTEQKFAFMAESASSNKLKDQGGSEGAEAGAGNGQAMRNLPEENGYVNRAMSQSEISTKL